MLVDFLGISMVFIRTIYATEQLMQKVFHSFIPLIISGFGSLLSAIFCLEAT